MHLPTVRENSSKMLKKIIYIYIERESGKQKSSTVRKKSSTVSRKLPTLSKKLHTKSET